MEKLTNIDIASLYGLVQALTTKEPSGWARRSYYDVALALLLDEGVRVPAPKGVRQVPLIHVHPLQRRFRTATRFSQTVMNTASRKARESSPAEIHVLIKRLRNYSECKGWLDWHIEHEWREHVERFGGLLVQEEHLASIANILGRNLDELREANTMPAEEICSRPQDLHIDMYLADVLVRGIYYDEQARLTNRRVVL